MWKFVPFYIRVNPSKSEPGVGRHVGTNLVVEVLKNACYERIIQTIADFLKNGNWKK